MGVLDMLLNDGNTTLVGVLVFLLWQPPPDSAENEGSRDSATFMRKVPEPLRQRCMRVRNSGASAPAGTSRV